MFRLLLNALAFVINARGNRRLVARRRPRIQLTLLQLEGRLVPSTTNRLWIGPADGTWNTAGNWADPTGASGVPQTGDNLVFDPNTTYNTKAGTDTNCEDNMSGLSVGTVYINSAYGHNITIDGTLISTYLTAANVNLNAANADLITGGNLSVTGTFTFSAGTVSGNGIVKMGSSSSFSWTGGTIHTLTYVGDSSFGTQPSMTISGNSTKYLTSSIYNWGNITWTGTGNVSVGTAGGLVNEPSAVFDIQTDASVTQYAGQTGSINNQGIFKKTQGTGTTAISANFWNENSDASDGLFLNSGTINFTGTAYSGGYANTQVMLQGGNLQTGATFYVYQGTLTGVGTITGNLSTDTPAEDGTGTGNIVVGLNNGPGQLNLVGDLEMTSGGKLTVYVSATGGVSVLNIQGGGTAELDGTLYVINSYAGGVANFTFLQYGQNDYSGDFATYSGTGLSWNYQGQAMYLASYGPNGGNYQLCALVPPQG